jgi:hypothetical protein
LIGDRTPTAITVQTGVATRQSQTQSRDEDRDRANHLAEQDFHARQSTGPDAKSKRAAVSAHNPAAIIAPPAPQISDVAKLRRKAA